MRLDASALEEVLDEALDDGGGASAYTSPYVAAAAAFFIGFGSGHGMAGARDDALLWLPVDLAVVAGGLAVGVLAEAGVVWALVFAGIVAERALQAMSAYTAADHVEPDDGNRRYDDYDDDRIDALGLSVGVRF